MKLTTSRFEIILQIRLNRKWLILCMLLISPLFIKAQELANQLNKTNGLSNNSITSIVQDQKGFVWIGTKEGLNRYDGSSIKIFDSKNSDLKSDNISDMALSANGTFYLGSSRGELYTYDFSKEKFLQLDFDGVGTVYKILNAKSGKLYIGTSKGLYELIDNGLTTAPIHIFGSKNLIVTDLVEGSAGELWLSTLGQGLWKMNADQFFEIIPKNKLIPSYLRSLAIHPDAADQIWLGTNDNGLMRYDILDSTINEENQSIQYNSKLIWQVYAEDKGYWIATEGDGVYFLSDNYEITHYNKDTKTAVAGQSITEVFRDREENIWIGTARDGISIISARNVNKQFDGFGVLSILGEDDILYIGTDGNGFWEKKNKKLSQSKLLDGVKYIQFLSRKERGEYWLGTYTNGLIDYQVNDGVKRQFTLDTQVNSISFNDTRDVVEYDNGDLWVATWGGGLNFYDATKKEWEVVVTAEKNDVASKNFIDILQYPDRSLYLATFGQGLLQINEKTHEVKKIDLNQGNKTPGLNNLFVLHSDQSGAIWVGTYKDGLVKYNPKNGRVEIYSDSSLLGRKTFVSIEEDKDENLWLGTKNGIIKYDMHQNKFYSYSDLKGEYHIKSSYHNKNGDMYFGSTNGITSFNPMTIKNREENSNVTFTDFKIFGKSVLLGQGVISKSMILEDRVKLNYDQNIFSIDFSTLTYPYHADIEYQVMLVGFEQEWRNLGNSTNATFTNLNPGNYELKVRAFRNQKAIGANSIDIWIDHPPWLTWWAYTAYLLLATIFLYLFRYYSIKWERMQKNLKIAQMMREKETDLFQLKQKFFTNVSHEIRTPVTLILAAMKPFEKFSLDKTRADALQILTKNGTHLLHLVNELLDFRKLEASEVKLNIVKIDLVEFSKEIFLSFKGSAIENDIDYIFDSNEESIDIWLDELQMEKVIYNLLSNAFKFTKPRDTIRLILKKEKEDVSILVSDTGQGIAEKKIKKIFSRFYQSYDNEKSQEGFGIGLSIVNDIVKLHSGEINVESKLNQGTSFRIKLALGKGNFDPVMIPSVSAENSFEEGYQEEQNSSYFEGLDNASILLVEDNNDIRAYLESVFEKSFDVLTAADGQEGLKLAIENIPDIIISDVMMPKMDGIAMTEKLKSDMRTSHIPIIILTARTSLVYKKEGFETGADDYITKPFNEILLKTRVSNLLRNRYLLRKKISTDKIIEPDELPVVSQDKIFLEELIDLIEKHISDGELKAEFLSKELGMSHSVVYKKVKSLTGLTLVEFVRDFRLKRAASLISQHGLSVNESCYKVGFSDRKYFGQVFKKKFGVSPSNYKN